MKCELLIANKRSGKIWDVANCTQTASWTTNRTGSPGTFKFTLNKCADIAFLEGDVVRFSVDGELQFYGWVFTKVKNRWDEIEVTCYDRLRYLKANASYAFYDYKAGDMIRQIAADFQLDVGAVADTGYAIPSFIKEDETVLDMIGEAVQQTLLNTGNIYVFFDDGNGLALRRPEDMISPVVIGERSLLTEYEYKTDIDEQTYNSVKLARPNEETGRWEVVIAEDSANIGQWGAFAAVSDRGRGRERRADARSGPGVPGVLQPADADGQGELPWRPGPAGGTDGLDESPGPGRHQPGPVCAAGAGDPHLGERRTHHGI